MKDIKQTDTGDIDTTGSDISFVESTLQHQRDLLLTIKGELKDSPSVGVGVVDFVNDEDSAELSTEIRNQFRKDGMTIREIAVSETIKIDAAYENS